MMPFEHSRLLYRLRLFLIEAIKDLGMARALWLH